MFLYDAIKLLYIFHTLTFFSANTQNIDLYSRNDRANLGEVFKTSTEISSKKRV